MTYGRQGHRPLVDYRNTPFLETSQTSAIAHRLNWRAEVILARNEKAIRNRCVLDLASHDGRFSYACLKLGVKHLTGIEGRAYLVRSANQNLHRVGIASHRFEFLHGDIFDWLPKFQPRSFDTILCLGLFYHTIRQVELLRQIKRLRPMHFILDSAVAKETLALRLDSWLRRKRLRRSGPVRSLGPAYMVFRREDHHAEGSTIDRAEIVATPTKTLIEQLLRCHGFEYRQIDWLHAGVPDWSNLRQYRRERRVSYVGSLPAS